MDSTLHNPSLARRIVFLALSAVAMAYAAIAPARTVARGHAETSRYSHIGAVPGAIAAGPEGNLWFTVNFESEDAAIGTVNPTTNAISEYSRGLEQPAPRVLCNATAEQTGSARVLVAYRCRGFIVERMEIRSNRTITYVKAKEEITTCKPRSGDRVVVCVEADLTSQPTEPSGAVIAVSGPLCPAHGQLKLKMVLTGQHLFELEEAATAEPAVKGPC